MADFEKDIKELDGIINKLNGGEASLDESIKLYEKGMKLTAALNKTLDENEKRIMIVMQGKEVDFEKPAKAEKEKAQTSLLDEDE